MAEFASSITKRGSLQKLPRGSRVGLSLLGGSPWQERDFVLEGDSLAYYAPGQGGFAKHLKGELRLAGCGVAACDGFVHGRVNCFKVTTAGGDRGDVVLSAETSAEAEAWIVAVRSAARGAGAAAPAAPRVVLTRAPSGDATAEDVDRVQDDTLAAVDRIRRQLEDSNAVAAQTSETLARQGEQMDDVNHNLTTLKANLERADKNLDKLERWRLPFWGGKSTKRGEHAAQGAALRNDAVEDVAHHDLDEAGAARARARGDRRNVTSGLAARDGAEAGALASIAAKDDAIEDGLGGLDDLLDSLGTAAADMNKQARAHNEKLRDMQAGMNDAAVGTARVNERANCNVKYYG